MPYDEQSLLSLKVSEILELHEGALSVLIEHGFAPLAQTHLRALLAPTVTLRQAMRIRSLSDAKERALLDDLAALLAAADAPEQSAIGGATAESPAQEQPCP